MDEHELAERAYALPSRFADRLDPADLATVHEYAEAGEWGEEIDLLLACLNAAGATGERCRASRAGDTAERPWALPAGPRRKNL